MNKKFYEIMDGGGGSIDWYKEYQRVNKELKEAKEKLTAQSLTPDAEQGNEGYWKRRCLAAEKVLSLINEDGSLKDGNYRAYNQWQSIRPTPPAIEEDGWVETEDLLPEVDTPVEIITEFESNASGKPVIQYDRFIGYMDEQGDCIICGSDDSYGWNFSDCVMRWKKLSPLPSPPTKKQ